jgi:hypothetical protein
MRDIESTLVETTTRSHQREVDAFTQVRHKVAEIEQRGGSPIAQSSGNCIGRASWFPATTVHKGKGSGKSAGHANNDTTVGYSTPPTGLTSQKPKNGSTKSGHSGKSQSLDERKSEREMARLSLELATAKREEAAAKIRIMTMDSQLLPSRGGSRGTSDASSMASSCQSRQVKQHRSKQKHAESEKSMPLHAQLEEILTSLREDSVTVDDCSMLQSEERHEITSGSVAESARSGSTDFYSNESPAQRTSTLRQSRSLQDAVANGAVATLPVLEPQITDVRSPITTPDHPRTRQSIVPQYATASGRVATPYCPSQDTPYDRYMGGIMNIRCNLTCFRPAQSFDLLGCGSSPLRTFNNYTLGGGPLFTVLFVARAYQPKLWVDLRVKGLHQPTFNAQSAYHNYGNLYERQASTSAPILVVY